MSRGRGYSFVSPCFARWIRIRPAPGPRPHAVHAEEPLRVERCCVERAVEGHETGELLAPYGEWAGLASLYLAMGFKHGLIPLPAERPVRFPRPAYA